MAELKVQEAPKVGETTHSATDFWARYKNLIIGISAAVILIAGGWMLYKNLYLKPKEERAAEAMFKAEEFFRNDSLTLALNGDGLNKGFLNVIKTYDGTKAGNLAHFYAGIIYLRTNDYNNAVKYLKDF